MEIKERGRHRLGGKHSDPIIVPNDQKKPSGRRAAKPVEDVTTETPIATPPAASAAATAVVIPPVPNREPTVHTGKVDTVVAPPKTGMISVVRHKGRFNTLAAIATGGLLIAGGGATAAHKPPKEYTGVDTERLALASDLELESEFNEIVAADKKMRYPKVDVKSKAAPPPPPPVPVVEYVPPVIPASPTLAPVPVPAPVPVAPPVDSGRAATVASAALTQLGVFQDCTRLVSNALAAAGISHHGWPVSYYNIGRPITAGEAKAGDLIYYENGGTGLAHIAVYIGNGQAVHGGWNGNQTVIFSANVGSGPRYIRV